MRGWPGGVCEAGCAPRGGLGGSTARYRCGARRAGSEQGLGSPRFISNVSNVLHLTHSKMLFWNDSCIDAGGVTSDLLVGKQAAAAGTQCRPQMTLEAQMLWLPLARSPPPRISFPECCRQRPSSLSVATVPFVPPG